MNVVLSQFSRDLSPNNISSYFKFFVVLAFTFIPYASHSQTCEVEYKRPWYKTRGAYCSAGEMVEDCYRKGEFFPCEEMEVDHTVSMFYAYQQGVCGDELKLLANDPDNLCLTHWKTNRVKGAKSPREFAEELAPKDRARLLNRVEVLERRFGLAPLNSQTPNYRFSLLAEEAELLRTENNILRSASPDPKIDPKIYQIIAKMKNRIGRVMMLKAGESALDVVPAKKGSGIATAALALTGFGLLASEIKMTCALSEDLRNLETSLRRQQNPNFIYAAEEKSKLCGMSASDIFLSLVGADVGSSTCAELRKENPLGQFDVCENISFQSESLEPDVKRPNSVLIDE